MNAIKLFFRASLSLGRGGEGRGFVRTQRTPWIRPVKSYRLVFTDCCTALFLQLKKGAEVITVGGQNVTCRFF